MKQFLKYLFASSIGTVVGFVLILFIGGIVIAGMIGSAVMMAGKSNEKIDVKPNTVLTIDLTTTVKERTKANPFEEIQIEGFEGEDVIELSDFVQALNYAETDSNIKGIMIKGPFFAGGLATMQTVREELEEFKANSGKWILAYDEAYSQGAYYLASTADEVYMFHEGMMDFRGLRSEVMYLTGAMEKLGIDATIIKGPNNVYKSAVEPFYRKDMSEENREQIARILDNVWGDMVSNLSADRGISSEELNRIANELAIKAPEDAVELGLIDGLAYYDEILANLRGKLGLEDDDDIESISIKQYAKVAQKQVKKDEGKSWELKDEIAVIYAVGGIDSGEGDEENIGSETTAKAIREARLDEDVKAIVLRVNSPGGSALASDVIWRETLLAKEAKPFIVSFGDVAASGGYYISTGADRIFAQENTITGSIGAFGMIPDLKGFVTEKLGFTFDVVKTNNFSDFGSLSRDMAPEELAYLEGYLNQVYTEFVSKVADGRGKSYAYIDSIGRGRVWTGNDALAIGLVDELGGLDDAINYAAEQAELEVYDIKELPKKKDPFEQFMKGFSGNVKATVGDWVFGDEMIYLEKIQEIKEMQGIQARMLYEIKVY